MSDPVRDGRQGSTPGAAPGEPSDEDDAAPDGLPPETPFYVTPEGHARLRAELHALWEGERPKVVQVVSWAASLGDRSENADYQYGKRRLREIDRRVRFLRKRLDRAQVVDASAQPRRDTVFFGATVTYARADDAEVTVTIVGVDEADLRRASVSWVSPVARALLGRQVGDLARLRTPQGEEEIELLAIRYPDPGAASSGASPPSTSPPSTSPPSISPPGVSPSGGTA